MPDWGDDDDVEEITPAIPVPPAAPRPPTQRWGRVRLGVDLGCVLLAKLPSGELPTLRRPGDVGIKMGYVPGAFEWFSDCVHNYGPDNVYVVSFVQSIRLRELRACLPLWEGWIAANHAHPRRQPGLDKFQVRQTVVLCR